MDRCLTYHHPKTPPKTHQNTSSKYDSRTNFKGNLLTSKLFVSSIFRILRRNRPFGATLKKHQSIFGDESIVEHVVAYVPPLRSSHHQDCFMFSSNISKKTFTMIELKHFNHVLDDGRCSFQWLKDFLLNHLWFPNSVGSKQEFLFHNTTLPQDIAKMALCFCVEFIRSRHLGILWFTFAGISDFHGISVANIDLEAGKINAKTIRM